MALIHCNFFSHILGMATSMDVILPDRPAISGGGGAAEDYPCLLLLHGLSDDHTIWQRRTSIERYVQPLGLAVVMPNAHRSFYSNMVHGPDYWTFISAEVLAVARSFFRLSARRENNFAAGISMGGYGAFKLALRHPERFAAAVSLSGALDIAPRVLNPEEPLVEDFRRIFGEDADIRGSGDDLFACASALAAAPGLRPKLYAWCGTEDFLYADNLRFRDHARSLGLDLTYSESRGGHDWDCWDLQIQQALSWLAALLPGLPRASRET